MQGLPSGQRMKIPTIQVWRPLESTNSFVVSKIYFCNKIPSSNIQKGRDPGLVVMGGVTHVKRSWVRIPAPDTGYLYIKKMNGNMKFMLYDDLRWYFLKKLDRFIDHDLSKWSLLPLREIYFISLIFCKHFAPPPRCPKLMRFTG